MINQAAIRFKGKVYTGKRHSDIFRENYEKSGIKLSGGEQGFVTEDGKFVDRIEAAKIAFECGQIKKRQDILFSEDLY